MDDPLIFLSKDNILKPLIKKYSLKQLEKSAHLFTDLVEAILSQQLSSKAAATITSRFLALFPDKSLNAEKILLMGEDSLRSVGISRQKISYLKNLSENISLGILEISHLEELSDDEVIIELTKVKGIGRWTAEMFLIFSLNRPDIFSVGDLGLRSAVSRLYQIDREDKIAIEKLSRQWTPYRSYASRLLWRSLDNEPKVVTSA